MFEPVAQDSERTPRIPHLLHRNGATYIDIAANEQNLAGQLVCRSLDCAIDTDPAGTRRSLLESVPPSFSADVLNGSWVTCYQFKSRQGIQVHADITYITPESGWRLTATNFPPAPRTQGHAPFRNEIEAQLANRHLIGHWKNISDTRYFGSVHLAVLPGEAVMEGYYTGLSSDILLETMRWTWVRLDTVSLSGVELAQVVLKEPDAIHAILEGSAYDAPLALTDVVEGN
ncbi:MAG: hypothetical protein ACRDRH_12345 [Pseudonocardia sp.]